MRVERRSDIELPGGREREGAGSEQEVGEEGKEGKEGKEGEGEARLPAKLKDVGLQVGQGAQGSSQRAADNSPEPHPLHGQLKPGCLRGSPGGPGPTCCCGGSSGSSLPWSCPILLSHTVTQPLLPATLPRHISAHRERAHRGAGILPPCTHRWLPELPEWLLLPTWCTRTRAHAHTHAHTTPP